jgi:uncharacterized protein YdaU (DUF1376 family)
VAELPWFPVYRDEWIGSPTVAAMLPEQEGALWRLLLTSWGDGSVEPSLPADDQQLATLSKLGPRWKKLGGLVRAQFEEREGRLYNRKLSAVWVEQTAKHAKASDKARVAALAKAEKQRREAAEKEAQRNAQGTPARTPPGSASSSAPSRTPSSTSGSARSTQNLEGTAPDSTPDGVESQEHVPAPDGALAPAGAAPRATGATANGNGHGTLPRAAVIAKLEEMGLPGTTWVEQPARQALSVPELAERRRLLEDTYFAQLRQRAEAWFARHPAETAAMERAVREARGFPVDGELAGLKAGVVREDLLEAWRELPRRNPIPSCGAWVAEREAAGALSTSAPEDQTP